jgi:hypothetical protein
VASRLGKNSLLIVCHSKEYCSRVSRFKGNAEALNSPIQRIRLAGTTITILTGDQTKIRDIESQLDAIALALSQTAGNGALKGEIGA